VGTVPRSALARDLGDFDFVGGVLLRIQAVAADSGSKGV